MKRFLTLLAASVLLAPLAACGSDDPESAGPSAEPVTITVFAAASLKTTFTELGERFEAENEGVTVEFSFAGSPDLVAQIQQGAPADVFASADENNMAKLTAEDLTAAEPQLFATNTLIIAVPPDNPAGVEDLDDLADDSVKTVVCATAVPCGAAAVKVEENAGIDISPVSEEGSVTDVLNKVATGEADAGLVYVTDVEAAGDTVVGIDFDGADDVVNLYPIAALADSDAADVAQAFVDFVLSEAGQAVLAEAGFGAP